MMISGCLSTLHKQGSLIFNMEHASGFQNTSAQIQLLTKIYVLIQCTCIFIKGFLY